MLSIVPSQETFNPSGSIHPLPDRDPTAPIVRVTVAVLAVASTALRRQDLTPQAGSLRLLRHRRAKFRHTTTPKFCALRTFEAINPANEGWCDGLAACAGWVHQPSFRARTSAANSSTARAINTMKKCDASRPSRCGRGSSCRWPFSYAATSRARVSMSDIGAIYQPCVFRPERCRRVEASFRALARSKCAK